MPGINGPFKRPVCTARLNCECVSGLSPRSCCCCWWRWQMWQIQSDFNKLNNPITAALILPAEATTVLFSASMLCFFSVNTITHKPLRLAWWTCVWIYILITSRSLLNIKVIGQRSSSCGFLCFFCVRDTAWTNWPRFTKCCTGMARGQYLALSKGYLLFAVDGPRLKRFMHRVHCTTVLFTLKRDQQMHNCLSAKLEATRHLKHPLRIVPPASRLANTTDWTAVNTLYIYMIRIRVREPWIRILNRIATEIWMSCPSGKFDQNITFTTKWPLIRLCASDSLVCGTRMLWRYTNVFWLIDWTASSCLIS